MIARVLRTAWRWLRWFIALGVIAFWLSVLAAHAGMQPMRHSLPFELWYGDWYNVMAASALFLSFVLALAWPRGRAEWRSAGLYSAFLISLFVEMFGVPLTILLLAPLLDLPAFAFGLGESHLWAYLLARTGIVPLGWGVWLVMTASLALIVTGMALLALGWAQVYGARDRLQTRGLYALIRHPQYLGLIFIVLAFNIQWPTLPTLVMAPLLIIMYIRQARREDRDLNARFGGEYLRYAARVPAFLPRVGRRAANRSFHGIAR
ncbi:MAG: methyltransferase family protein [Woeseiaceae bacterium]